MLGTGQSLSLGMMGTPPISTAQPYDNRMFDTGLTGAEATSFVPLVEGARCAGRDARVRHGEPRGDALARVLHRPYDLLVSLHGVSGASYPMLEKGTEPYARGLAQVTTAKAIAAREGKRHVVRAITVVHGESDGWQNWNTEYDRALVQWQSDYEQEIRAITGQTEPVPMFHSQYSGWTPVEPTPYSVIPGAQLEAHARAPGKVVLVGPKYFLP